MTTNGITTTDLRPCLLVNLDCSRRGGQHYTRANERVIPTEDGSEKSEWETEKTIDNPDEFAEATSLQGKAKRAFAKLGRHTPGGIVVNRDKQDEVNALIEEWNASFDEFNTRATTTEVNFWVWVFDVTGENVSNLQVLIDQLADYLESLEQAVRGVEPAEIRDVLKRLGGFTDLLPETVGLSLTKAVASAKKRADNISGGTRRIKLLETKLAEELGVEDPAEIEAAVQQVLAAPLTEDIVKKARRIAKLTEAKQGAVDSLSQVKRDIDTSSVRLARFAILGNKDAAQSRTDDDEGSEDLSDSLYGAQAAARFGRFSSAAAPSL